MTKKEQRERNRQKREFWTISPVTRVKESKKIYNRKRFNHRFNDKVAMDR